MPEIHVTLLGRFAVAVGGVPVAEAGWKRRHAAAMVKVLALEWAETRREQLSQSHLDLLRLDGRWEAVAALDPGDERAHLALMRRYAASGDRPLPRALPAPPGSGKGFLRSRYGTHADVNRRAYDRVVRIYHE